MVAITFLGFPEKNINTVNHINGNRLDNRIENLEWLSIGDNVRHGFETGLMPNRKVKLFNKRVRNGYISIPICMILCGVLCFVVASFELSRIGTIVALAVSFVVILITYGLIIVKCHFWACPYCDTLLSKRTSYMAYNCPQCGKRLRK